MVCLKQHITLCALGGVLMLGLFACAPSEEPSTEKTITTPDYTYAFFVAGHAYGTPGKPQYGLYPPFKRQIDYINTYPKMDMGFLTGDVVVKPTEAYWDSLILDMSQFKCNWYLAPGNHDRSPEYDKRFKSDYQSFVKHDDLFITLSPNNWNIKGEQLAFLKTTLETHAVKVRNVFIFVHELVWWSPDNKFGRFNINFRPHYPGSSNYWADIHPILKTMEKPVYLFAGDVGATSVVDPYMYYVEDNVHFIASGMGNGAQDNIIITHVNSDGKVHLDLIGIHAEKPFILDLLTDWELPE